MGIWGGHHGIAVPRQKMVICGAHCGIPRPKEKKRIWGGHHRVPIPTQKKENWGGHCRLFPQVMLPSIADPAGALPKLRGRIVHSLFSCLTKPSSAAGASQFFPELSWEFSAPITSSHRDGFCDTSPKNTNSAGLRWRGLSPAGN